MAELTQLEALCLAWIADDYEAISHIRDCVRRHHGLDASEREVCSSVLRLVEARLADAFDYDVPGQKFLKTVGSTTDVRQQWFYITPLGVDALQENRKQHPDWWPEDQR